MWIVRHCGCNFFCIIAAIDIHMYTLYRKVHVENLVHFLQELDPASFLLSKLAYFLTNQEKFVYLIDHGLICFPRCTYEKVLKYFMYVNRFWSISKWKPNRFV